MGAPVIDLIVYQEHAHVCVHDLLWVNVIVSNTKRIFHIYFYYLYYNHVNIQCPPCLIWLTSDALTLPGKLMMRVLPRIPQTNLKRCPFLIYPSITIHTAIHILNIQAFSEKCTIILSLMYIIREPWLQGWKAPLACSKWGGPVDLTAKNKAPVSQQVWHN